VEPQPPPTQETPAPVAETTPPPAPTTEPPKSQTAPTVTTPSAAKGAIIVTISEPGFTLTLDGKPISGFRPSGPNQYLIAGLNAGRRTLAAQKAGFRADPESAAVNVVENQTQRVVFKLAPNGPGRWSLQGARPGTQVVHTASGRVIGTADAQGNASGADLPEGWQELELRLKGYHRRSGFRVNIRPGQEGTITGSDTQLERIDVLVELQGVEPRTAMLTIEHTRFELKYDGPTTLRTLPAQIKLPPGTYNLTFSAPGFESETITVGLKDYPLAPKVKLRAKK